MKNPPIRILWACTFFVRALIPPAFAQVGYIAVHVKALNEESSPSFSFTVSGGPTAVPSFSLSDLPGTMHCSDLGGGHGTTGATGSPDATRATGVEGGAGELWVVAGPKALTWANGLLVHRTPGATGWVSKGDSAAAVDGAGPGQCVYTTKFGFVVAYDNGRRDTLYYPANHGGHRAADVGNNAYLVHGKGVTAIVDDRGDLLVYTGDYNGHSDAWTDISTLEHLPSGASHVDVTALGDDILFSTTGGGIYEVSAAGTLTALGKPGKVPTNADVAFNDAGQIFVIAETSATDGDGVYNWQGGTAWKADSTSRNIEHITGGAAGALWGVNNVATNNGCKSEVFFRSTDSTHFWYDNEWMTIGWGNTIFLPVAAGTYTVAETVPGDWACQAIAIDDPTHNSTASVQAHSATLQVAPGEVITVNFQDGLVQPAAIPQICNYAIQQDFGAGSAAIGAPLKGQTDYHYLASTFMQDGYYTLAKTTGTLWGNQNLTDHTNGKGYFMIVNASYGLDEFYRERVTGLVPGLRYTLSAYIADLSPQLPLRPNVSFGIMDASSGSILGSVSTGPITNTAWKQYQFTFTATAVTADIYLSNNARGGTGNDLALDDIAFSPIADPVSRIQLATAASSDTICQGSLLQLFDSASGGTWASLDPSLAAVDARGTVVARTGGKARITFSTVNSIGCIAADTLAVTVWPRVQPSAIHVTQASVCTGDSAVLRASADLTGPRFSWYTDSTLGHLVDTGAVLSLPRPAASATYFVTAAGQETCVGPPVPASVTVYAYPSVQPIAGGAQVCAGDTLALSDPTPGGVWSGSVSGVFTTLQAGADTVRYTVVNGGTCGTSVTHTINVWASPSISPILGARNLCERDTLTVTDSTPGGIWTGTSISPMGLVTATAPGPSNIVYTVTGAHGCQARVSASLQVEVAPPAPGIDAGPAPSVCGGRAQSLQAVPGDRYAYRWYLDGNRFGTDSGALVSTVLPGAYSVVAVTDAGCTSAAGAFMEISSRCEINPQADVSLRKTVSPGPYNLLQPVTYTLTVTNNGPGLASGINVVDSLSPNLGEPAGYSGFYNGTNRVLYWTIPTLAPGDSVVLTFSIPLEALNDVANTAHVTTASPDPDPSNNSGTAMIYEESGLFIPNAVSPNGDGKNDRFLIVGLDRYPGSSLTVFNRWGNEVYHSDNYANDWGGVNLNDGTYFYILILNTGHGKEAHKGWVEILHK